MLTRSIWPLRGVTGRFAGLPAFSRLPAVRAAVQAPAVQAPAVQAPAV